jgi:hypothetical protein
MYSFFLRFIIFIRQDAIPGASEDDLIESMKRVYEELNDSLLRKLAQGKVPTFMQLHAQNDDYQNDELLQLLLARAELEEEKRLRDARNNSEAGKSTPSSPSSSKKGGGSSSNSNVSSTSKALELAAEYLKNAGRSSRTAGVAEAVLFGHMAEVFSTHEDLALVLQQYEGLLCFFQYIASTFFSEPYLTDIKAGTDTLFWRVSILIINLTRVINLTYFLNYAVSVECIG